MNKKIIFLMKLFSMDKNTMDIDFRKMMALMGVRLKY